VDTSSVKVFLPGITDTTTLEAASVLCGQASWKLHGQDHASLHDVASPDMIRQLPTGFALVIRGGNAPVIARLPRAWNRLAYRRARRAGVPLPGRPYPLSTEPDLAPDGDLGYGLESGQETDEWPDFLPPGWTSGYDGSSFPWS
jgi:hypothetical protein